MRESRPARNKKEVAVKVKRTERGWPGHFICADKCLFRRNTLLECGEKRVVVSTVGAYIINDKMEQIGNRRYYETMAFEAIANGPYWDADVSSEFSFESKWSITGESIDDIPLGVDNIANEMHEAVVAEITETLKEEEANNG